MCFADSEECLSLLNELIEDRERTYNSKDFLQLGKGHPVIKLLGRANHALVKIEREILITHKDL